MQQGLVSGSRPSVLALDGQTLAALGAACVDHSTATLGLHADEETVGTGAADFGRLVSTFHDAIPREAWFRFDGNRAALSN